MYTHQLHRPYRDRRQFIGGSDARIIMGEDEGALVRLAQDLGVDEDWLWDVANEMDIEDGAIWVYGVGEGGVQAFTDFGIENLIELVSSTRKTPNCSGAGNENNPIKLAAYAGCVP
jgi:hypothetical protein